MTLDGASSRLTDSGSPPTSRGRSPRRGCYPTPRPCSWKPAEPAGAACAGTTSISASTWTFLRPRVLHTADGSCGAASSGKRSDHCLRPYGDRSCRFWHTTGDHGARRRHAAGLAPRGARCSAQRGCFDGPRMTNHQLTGRSTIDSPAEPSQAMRQINHMMVPSADAWLQRTPTATSP